MQEKIQAIIVTYDAVGGAVCNVNIELDKDFPYLKGFGIFLPDMTNVVAPILKKTQVGGDYYLPDDFPLLGIATTKDQGIAPNERFLTLLDTLFHEGKKFFATIEDSGASVNYEVCYLFHLSKIAD